MPKNTEEIKEKKINDKLDKKAVQKEKKDVSKVVEKKQTKKSQNKTKSEKNETLKKNQKLIENKSVQNNVIENIKSFISKIKEMQEKVKKDEEEEKREKEKEKSEKKLEEDDEHKYILEYYDLPYRYNETVVKILAQTPKRLFVYWDISDKDRETYLNAFGENFFNDTYPVLLVHNENKDYTLEVTINDFANSWYLDVADPRDKYTIQLGRKFKSYVKPHINPEIGETKNVNLNNDYLFIAMSNKLEVPNDHILFEEFKPDVKYRNVKTNKEEIKILNTTTFKNELQNLYKKLYKDGEIIDDKFDIQNPSSIGTSSSIRR